MDSRYLNSVQFATSEFPEEIASFLGTIQQLSYPPQGVTSTVAIVEGTNGTYVVKCSRGEQFSNWLKQEYRVLSALARTPLPTPYPHVFFQRETWAGVESWLVMSYLAGDPLIAVLQKETDREARRNILRAFGQILSLIHHSSIPEELQNTDKPWLNQMLERAQYNLHHFNTEGDVELLTHLKQHRPHPVPATLIHGDFTADNVLISKGKVMGVIDWAGGGMGDPRYDLALAIRPNTTGLFQKQHDRQAFFEGYRTTDNLSTSEYNYFVSLYEFF